VQDTPLRQGPADEAKGISALVQGRVHPLHRAASWPRGHSCGLAIISTNQNRAIGRHRFASLHPFEARTDQGCGACSAAWREQTFQAGMHASPMPVPMSSVVGCRRVTSMLEQARRRRQSAEVLADAATMARFRLPAGRQLLLSRPEAEVSCPCSAAVTARFWRMLVTHRCRG
jgi:hypothetical protein